MVEAEPEPDLSHRHRGRRDAEVALRSPWLYVPLAVLTSAAAIAGALIPRDASMETKVILAGASATGLPLVAGVVLFLVMLACAPRKRREDLFKARINALEDKVQPPSESGLTTIHTEGGVNHFHFEPGGQG